jgi:hypothetical protein
MLGNDYGGFPGQLFLKAGSASTRMEITGGGAGGTRTTISNATGDTGDSGTLELAGGGDFSSTRGSYIISYGNEHGSKPGRLELVAGDTGYISTTGDIKTTAASTIVSTDAENKGIQFSAAPNVVDPSKGAYVYMTGASSGVPGLLQLSGGNNGYIHVHPAFSTPAGGSSATGIRLGTAGPGIYFGSGAPSVSAAKGSLYLRSDGSGTADRAYINTNGSTTWTALTTAA